MPSYNQEIKVHMSPTENRKYKSDQSNEQTTRNTTELQLNDAPAGLRADQRLAFALRDFLGTPSTIPDNDGRSISTVDENLSFIDDQTDNDNDTKAEEEQPRCREAQEVLNNAACRLRRWRAASRKLRRPRIIDNLCAKNNNGGGAKAFNEVHTDLADRLRSLAATGSMSASAGELLSLAPPPSASTAPPSPGCLQTPTLADQSSAKYFGSSPECCVDSTAFELTNTAGFPVCPPGPRYKLVTEGSLKICCFQHTRTVVDKILATKFLRRWESHVLCLLEDHVISKTPSGFLEHPLSYSCMQEVYCISRWDPARKFCLRIVMPHGSLLLQANDAYARDNWFHSITWRKNMIRYRNFLTKKVRKEIVMKELKNMVDFAMTTPLQDVVVTTTPLQLLTNLLSELEGLVATGTHRIRQTTSLALRSSNAIVIDFTQNDGFFDEPSGTNGDQPERDSPFWEEWAENAISVAAPLLADRCVNGELFYLLARLCRRRPRAAPLPALAPPVRRVLTRNVDFGKAPNARQFVKDYISALSTYNSGASLVRRFVEVAHGKRAACPHPRAAANLVAVALAALDEHYRDGAPGHACGAAEQDVLCFADILVHMSEYEDWLVVVANVLQPLPFCAGALSCPNVAKRLEAVLTAITNDTRCSVHECVHPTRPGRPSWLLVASPTDPKLPLPYPQLCKLWGNMVKSLLSCCSNRKTFLQGMSKQLTDFIQVAKTEHPAVLEALCLMLEWELPTNEETKQNIIAALKDTEQGKIYYEDLRERQEFLQKLQAAGGPRRLSLPMRATDADVEALLSSSALGNLEFLSLAFTSVTSACAHHIIKLPSLRYLNLWATKFGDSGVQLIAEHLPRLQALNLCETPISDKGIEALSGLSSLRFVNLNSTKLSANAFEVLRQRLPRLRNFDVRYTDAWGQ